MHVATRRPRQRRPHPDLGTARGPSRTMPVPARSSSHWPAVRGEAVTPTGTADKLSIEQEDTEMTTPQTFVIAGASLAGAKAAETLRSEGFDGRVVLIGEEPVRPYERPPLSKAYLRGEVDFDSAAVPCPARTSTRSTTSNCSPRPPSLSIDPQNHDGSKWTRVDRWPMTNFSSPPAPPRDG